jgi:hypothetical protein
MRIEDACIWERCTERRMRVDRKEGGLDADALVGPTDIFDMRCG